MHITKTREIYKSSTRRYGMNKIAALTLVTGLAFSAWAADHNEQNTFSTSAISTETVSLKEVAPKAEGKKDWSFNLLSEQYTGVKSNTHYKGDIVADQKAEVRYKLSDRNSVSLAYEWSQSYKSRELTHATVWDPSIRFSTTGYKLPSDISYSFQGRVYLPTSSSSQDANQIAQVRIYNKFSKEIANNLKAGLLIHPRFYAQDSIGSSSKGANRFRLLNSASLSYSFADNLSVATSLGVYSQWRQEVSRKDNLDAATEVSYSPIGWLDLAAGVRQVDGASDTRSSGARLYSGEQIEYFLVASMTL